MTRRRVKMTKHDAALLDLEAAGAALGLTAHRLAVRIRKGQLPQQVVVKLGKRIFIAEPAMRLWLAGQLQPNEPSKTKVAV